MMQDACKTPWKKADTSSAPVRRSLTHSYLQICNLTRSHQSAANITTDMLEDTFADMLWLNWKSNHVKKAHRE